MRRLWEDYGPPALVASLAIGSLALVVWSAWVDVTDYRTCLAAGFPDKRSGFCFKRGANGADVVITLDEAREYQRRER